MQPAHRPRSNMGGSISQPRASTPEAAERIRQQFAQIVEYAVRPAHRGWRAHSSRDVVPGRHAEGQVAPPRRAMIVSTSGSSPTTPRGASARRVCRRRNAARAARACRSRSHGAFVRRRIAATIAIRVADRASLLGREERHVGGDVELCAAPDRMRRRRRCPSCRIPGASRRRPHPPRSRAARRYTVSTPASTRACPTPRVPRTRARRMPLPGHVVGGDAGRSQHLLFLDRQARACAASRTAPPGGYALPLVSST